MKKFNIIYTNNNTGNDTVFKNVEARNWARAKEMTDKKLISSKVVSSKGDIVSMFSCSVKQVNDKNTEELLTYI